MGAASLPVFCAHLALALMALALFGEANPERPWRIDVTILVVSFAVLYGVARISATLDRQAAELKSRVSARRRAARSGSAGGAP